MRRQMELGEKLQPVEPVQYTGDCCGDCDDRYRDSQLRAAEVRIGEQQKETARQQ